MNAIDNTTDQLIANNQALIEEARTALIAQGKTIDLSHWLTLKRYAQKYHLETTMVVSNWISRGIIPPEDVIQLNELNGLKLVKDKVYKIED